MKRVLLLSYYFPPSAAVGAKRPLGFASHLAEHGWSPSVVTASPEGSGPNAGEDRSLLDALPPGLPVRRIGHSDPRRRVLDLRARIRQVTTPVAGTAVVPAPERGTPASAMPAPRRSGPVASTLRTLWERAFEFPDLQKYWRGAVTRSARTWPAAERPDVVFATGGPWTTLVTGRDIARQFKVPLVVDFRDPWTSDERYLFESQWLTDRARRLHRDICREAAAIVTNTEELQSEFTQDFPECADRLVFIPNGYSESIRGTRRPRAPFDDVPELAHFGSMYDAYGDPNVALLPRALVELVEAGRLAPGALRVRFVGTWEFDDPALEATMRRLEEWRLVSREPPVSFRECVEQMAQVEALLLFQPTTPVRIPAKTYEYLAADRPIVVVGGAGATSTFLETNFPGQSRLADLESMKEFLVRFSRREISLSPPMRSDVTRFGYRALTGRLAEILDRATARRDVIARQPSDPIGNVAVKQPSRIAT